MDGHWFTPSQNQVKVSNGIPQPTARFYNTETKETVLGQVQDWLYEDDTWIRILPEKTLSAGKWELTVTALTDDIENTISSRSFPFEQAGAVDSTGLHVVWAAVSNTPDYNRFRQGLDGNNDEVSKTEGRYIFIKYSEPLSNTELGSSALVNSNYTVSGVEVPRTANVTRFIEGYSNGKAETFDSVTIDLGAEDYKKFNLKVGKPVSISIASSIKATSGNTLGDTGRITLPYKYGTNDADVTGGAGVGYEGIEKSNDDVWGNDASEFAGGALSDLQAALDNEKYRTIMLGTNYTIGEKDTLNIKRPVTIDLAGNTLTVKGTLAVSYVDTGMLKIINSKATSNAECGKIDVVEAGGVMTINTPNAELFVGEGTGTAPAEITKLKIVDLLKNTFYNYGTIGELTVTDGGGTGIRNEQGAKIEKLIIDAASKMVLVNKGTMDQVTVKRANSIEVRQETGSVAITDLVSEKADLNIVIRFENPKAENNDVTNVITNTKNCIVKDTAGTDFTENVTDITKAIDAQFARLKDTVKVTSGSSIDILNGGTEVYKKVDEKLSTTVTTGNNKELTVEYAFETAGKYFVAEKADDKTTGVIKLKDDVTVAQGATEVLTITATATLEGKEYTRTYTIKLEKG